MPNNCRKTHEEDYTNFMIFVSENLHGKVAQKRFGQVEEMRAKILRTHKNLPAPTPLRAAQRNVPETTV